jgi:hypothetical protein
MLVDGRVLEGLGHEFLVGIAIIVLVNIHLYERWTLKDLAAKYQYVEYSECWAHAFSPKLYEHAPLRVPQRSADVPIECCRLVVACGVEQVFMRKPAGSRTTPQRSRIMQGQHVVRMHPSESANDLRAYRPPHYWIDECFNRSPLPKRQSESATSAHIGVPTSAMTVLPQPYPNV